MVERLFERLSFRQARSTVLVAILLGLLAMGVEFYLDVRNEREAITETARQVVRIVQEPASKASYDLDRTLAANVLDGLFSYQPIYHASLHNEFGRLAMKSRPPVQTWWRWLSEWLFGGNLEVRVPLTYHPMGRGPLDVGEIRVGVDIHLAATAFLNRAGTTIVNGFLRNVLLGLVLTAVFHFMVTKPILAICRDMERVTPDAPSSRLIRFPEGHRNNELGFLVGRFNELLTAFGATLKQRDQYEADLQAARRRAEEASHAKSQFLATMSHELRTPLNAIIGFSELIRSDHADDVSAHADYAGEILTSGNRLLAIINDILDLAEMDTGDRRLAFEPVDMRGLLGHSLGLVDPLMRERYIRAQVDVPDGVPPALADARALRQAIVNLLLNAAKFTPEGGSVTVGVQAEGGMLLIDVSDTGIGIAPENIPRATEAFWQEENFLSRRHGGTGLGLPIAKVLVEMHGGTLSIRSTLGKGTTVRIEVPAVVPGAAAVSPEARSGSPLQSIVSRA